MTTSNQLLPCPFCGGSAAYQRLRDGSKYGAYECGECGAQGPDVRTGYGQEEEWRDKATAAWNERSADTPPAAAHGDEAATLGKALSLLWKTTDFLPRGGSLDGRVSAFLAQHAPEPVASAAAAHGDEAVQYRLLRVGELIQATDELLRDDCTTWTPMSEGRQLGIGWGGTLD